MNVLLDTNAFLWQVQPGGGKLGPLAKDTMISASKVYVSSISIVEIHIKTMLGKLKSPIDLEKLVVESNDEVLSFDAKAADQLRASKGLDRHDPFDRMILSHSLSEGIKLITSDRTLLYLGLDSIIDATK